MISTLLIDNQPLVGQGLRAALDQAGDFSIIGEKTQISHAIADVATGRPDVVIIGSSRIREELFAAIVDLTASFPPAAVLLLAPSATADTVVRAISSGVAAYLPIDVSGDFIVETARTLTQAGMVIPRSIGFAVFREFAPALDTSNRAVLGRLSRQEHQILNLLAAGMSNTEIASTMIVAEATVKKHLTALLRKLGCRDRLQAGLYGWQIGLGRTTDAPRWSPGSTDDRP